MTRLALVIASGCTVIAVAAVLLVLTSLRPPAPAAEDAAETAVPLMEPGPAPSVAEAPPASPSASPPAAAAPVPPAPAAPAASAPTIGTVRIESDVPGAQVFLDRQFVGTAPVTAENLRPGSHQLNVSADGFDGVARTLEVEAGSQVVTVSLREVRLDAVLDVVHRHRIGSCQGRLIASPQGLRYETTHAEDGFSVGLADLQTFDVDYQETNLRVRLPNGRQYNFTDPEGHADPLFVFHRDVDRARQRLAQGDPPAGD